MTVNSLWGRTGVDGVENQEKTLTLCNFKKIGKVFLKRGFSTPSTPFLPQPLTPSSTYNFEFRSCGEGRFYIEVEARLMPSFGWVSPFGAGATP